MQSALEEKQNFEEQAIQRALEAAAAKATEQKQYDQTPTFKGCCQLLKNRHRFQW